MPFLKNPKKERFAQAYVRGRTAGNATASYEEAGYTGKGGTARVSASRMRRSDEVARRIAELQMEQQAIETAGTARAIERVAITKEGLLRELARIAFASITDYVRPAGEGHAVFDLSKIDRDKGAAVQEVILDTRQPPNKKGGRPISRLKLADKQAALVALGKHFGLFVDGRHATDDFTEMNDEELIASLRTAGAQLVKLGVDVHHLFGGGQDPRAGAPSLAQEASDLPPVSEAARVPRGREDLS